MRVRYSSPIRDLSQGIIDRSLHANIVMQSSEIVECHVVCIPCAQYYMFVFHPVLKSLGELALYIFIRLAWPHPLRIERGTVSILVTFCSDTNIAVPRPSFRKCCKGGQKYIFIKIGGANHKSVCDSTRPLGGSGGMPPQEIFVFRLSKIESGAFSGKLTNCIAEWEFWKHLYTTM